MNVSRTGIHEFRTPAMQSAEAAGYDLQSLAAFKLFPGERKLVPTGWAFQIPVGMVGLICPRSGLAAKHGVTVLNAPGIIDSDYRGEVKVLLINLGDQAVEFKTGDRIAQMVVTPCYQQILREMADLESTDRGTGGFGHTGR